MNEEKPKKKPNRIRPQKTVTLNPRNLEAAAEYEARTQNKISKLIDTLLEKHFVETGYLSNDKPRALRLVGPASPGYGKKSKKT
jgi:hypothetical protein